MGFKRKFHIAALAGATLALIALPSAALAADPPNVLVVMTDDQPMGTVSRMPFLSSKAEEFAGFTEAVVSTPLCCPSRATFQSGLYAHHSRVVTNDDGEKLDPSHSIATVFDDAGYDVGLFGKYLNGFPWGRPGYVPPGYDRWVSFAAVSGRGEQYYDYQLSIDGTLEPHGAEPEDYSTNVLTDYADAFIAEAHRPFFAMFAPFGPHNPFTAAPGDETAFDGAPSGLRPRLNAVQSDPHDWWAGRPPIDRSKKAEVARSQFETLLSVDLALERFFQTLDELGELDDTIVLFVSDNGYSLGAHRWTRKACFYEDCIRVPLMIRAPGIEPGKIDSLVSNVDFATTLADLAGLKFGPSDGVSFVPLLDRSAAEVRREILLRVKRDDASEPPTGWGIRTAGGWKLIEYRNGEIDMFDLDHDPYELDDLRGQRRYRSKRRELMARLNELRP